MANTIYEEARQVYADGPTGAPLQPSKAEIRRLFKTTAEAIDGASIGRIDQATWSGLVAIVGATAGQPARVVGPDAGTHADPVIGGSVPNVGEYVWSPSPAGWQRIGGLVRTIVYASNTNSGDANAVTATADGAFDATPGKALITVNFVATNTGAMTISIDGETPRALVTNTGAPVPSGYVNAGMSALVQIDSDGNYRLFSYGDATAVAAAAEASAEAAQEAAQLAADAPQHMFASKALAEASPPLPGPPSVILMTGFDTANDFRLPKPFINVGGVEPAEYLKVQIGGSWYHLGELQEIDAGDWGVSAANSDNTAAYSRIIAGAPEGAKIIFPPKRTLVGNFLSPLKVFDIDGNGATLVPATNPDWVIAMGHGPHDTRAVLDASLERGARQFSVIGASGYYQPGDIGFLWDGTVSAADPSSTNTNRETIKIQSVSGDVITVEGFIRAHKGRKPITFTHTPRQHKNAAVRNVRFLPPLTHTAGAQVSIFNCEGVTFENLHAEAWPVHMVRAIRCWNVRTRNLSGDKPPYTGPGDGYVFAARSCTGLDIQNSRGLSARHVVDLESCYDATIDHVRDPDSKAAPVVIAHNGFGADIRVRDVKFWSATTVSGIVASSQGFGTGPDNALAEKHPFIGIDIEGVEGVLGPGASPVGGTPGVLLANHASGSIRRIKIDYTGDTSDISNFAMSCIRINGSPIGTVHIEDIDMNAAQQLVFVLTTTNTRPLFPDGRVEIRGLRSSDRVRWAVRTQGAVDLDVDGFNLNNVDVALINQSAGSAGSRPLYCAIGDRISYNGPSVPILVSTPSMALPAMKGKFALLSRDINGTIPVIAGTELTNVHVDNSGRLLTLSPPSGAGTITLGAAALPRPYVDGEEILITSPAGVNSVTFPAGATIHAEFTVAPGTTRRCLSYDYKWLAL